MLHVDSVQKADIEDLSPSSTATHYSIAVPGTIDDGKISSYFAFRAHAFIWYTLQQTTRLSKFTIKFPYATSSQKSFSNVKFQEIV